MYVVTGGAGFIGSAMIWKLNRMGITDIVVVDNLGTSEKWKNLVNLKYEEYIHKDTFLDLAIEEDLPWEIEAIIHMGACSSTTEADADYLMENNYRYSTALCQFALSKGARFINASSAATYGGGEFGFGESEKTMLGLKPLNMYGYTKQLFDLWAYRTGVLDKIASLKFFNVFGPNEYHKGDMMSVVCKSHPLVKQTGEMKLFKSYREEYSHGGQQRDFVYVKDCVDVMWWLLEHPAANGIFNVGTGNAQSWNDLAGALFAALNKDENITYIEMPDILQGKYQYFTEAKLNNLRAAGYEKEFTPLKDAVKDYVQNYLEKDDPYLDAR